MRWFCASFIILALTLTACAGHKDARTAGSPINGEMVVAAREIAFAGIKEKDSGTAKDLAVKGMDLGDKCVAASPEKPGCYYWRAVNTGLYHKVHVVGYQRGIKRMIDDCNKVIELDPSYDNAGAYRILGQIYTQLPQTGGTAESVTRDLPLAEKNLREAVRLAPDYPENYLALAETLLDEEKTSEAQSALSNAKHLAVRFRNDISYDDWRISMKGLEKKIAKAAKK